MRSPAATVSVSTSARRTAVPVALSIGSSRSHASIAFAAIFPERMASTTVRGPCSTSPPA